MFRTQAIPMTSWTDMRISELLENINNSMEVVAGQNFTRKLRDISDSVYTDTLTEWAGDHHDGIPVRKLALEPADAARGAIFDVSVSRPGYYGTLLANVYSCRR